MLSNLVITKQRLVLVIDELDQERTAKEFICQLLREQGQEELTIKTLPRSRELSHPSTFLTFLIECGRPAPTEDGLWNVLLPPLSDLLIFQRPGEIFQFLHSLRKCTHLGRAFVWACPNHLRPEISDFLLGACEYMADLVLHLRTNSTLSIVTCKPHGGVTRKFYNCKKTNNQIFVTQGSRTNVQKSPEPIAEPKPEPSGTFKIELDEDELVARSALKLPYERTSEEPMGGDIIYTPDDDDDFDEEDPDEDLCI